MATTQSYYLNPNPNPNLSPNPNPNPNSLEKMRATSHLNPCT